jgi:hypothetical protein
MASKGTEEAEAGESLARCACRTRCAPLVRRHDAASVRKGGRRAANRSAFP